MINKRIILNGSKYFYTKITQNCLVFTSAKKHIKYFSSTAWIDTCISNGKSEENIENITKSGSNFPPTFADHHVLHDVNFNGHCLMKNNSSILKKYIYIYIYSYTLN